MKYLVSNRFNLLDVVLVVTGVNIISDGYIAAGILFLFFGGCLSFAANRAWG